MSKNSMYKEKETILSLKLLNAIDEYIPISKTTLTQKQEWRDMVFTNCKEYAKDILEKISRIE